MNIFGWRLSRNIPDNVDVNAVHEKFMSVIFTLIGTTQGLAIGALASKTPSLAIIDWQWNDFYAFLHFSLCFTVLTRVTQAYICGALEYVQKIFSVIDLTCILLIGLLQYLIIDALGNHDPNPSDLHKRILILSMLAVILHIYIIYKAKTFGDKPYSIRMQVINTLFAIAACVICVLGWKTESAAIRALSSLAMIVIIMINVSLSLEDTDFSGRKQIILFKRAIDKNASDHEDRKRF